MANVLVIDVGSHKAEEVWLLAGRPRFSARNYYRLLRHQGLKGIATAKSEARSFARNFSCRYILVEPVAHRELLDFLEFVPSALFLKGVVSCGESGPETLLLAKESVGHSIIPSKPGLSGDRLPTYNLNFRSVYEMLIDAFVMNGDCDRIILRMNAEGVEGPIIDFLVEHASRKPDVFAGSIGDIEKCFGREAYDRAKTNLENGGIPFVYLTSNSTTWASGLKRLSIIL
jgi:hypothetical protein